MTAPRLPEIGEFVRHHGRLLAIEDVTPEPPPQPVLDYIFEEISARGELRRLGKVVKEIETLNDFYGLETSVRECIREMQEYAKAEAIGPDSEVEVVVVRVVSCYRARPKPSANFYDESFRDFAALDHGSKWTVPDDVETVAWSTKAPR